MCIIKIVILKGLIFLNVKELLYCTNYFEIANAFRKGKVSYSELLKSFDDLIGNISAETSGELAIDKTKLSPTSFSSALEPKLDVNLNADLNTDIDDDLPDLADLTDDVTNESDFDQLSVSDQELAKQYSKFDNFQKTIETVDLDKQIKPLDNDFESSHDYIACLSAILVQFYIVLKQLKDIGHNGYSKDDYSEERQELIDLLHSKIETLDLDLSETRVEQSLHDDKQDDEDNGDIKTTVDNSLSVDSLGTRPKDVDADDIINENQESPDIFVNDALELDDNLSEEVDEMDEVEELIKSHNSDSSDDLDNTNSANIEEDQVDVDE